MSDASTQQHLPIAGILEDVILLADGSARAVLRCDPVNFELKSEQEQNAIIYSYQSFLNALDFPVQVVVQSKRLDLERYLIRLQDQHGQVENDLLRIQMQEYVSFVRRLISVANIMSKRFYVTVSFSLTTANATKNQFNSLLHKQPTGPLMDSEQFGRLRSEVLNRAGLVANGLARLGVKAELLETQRLIELYYGIYNPDVATEERLPDQDLSVLSGAVVSSELPVTNEA